MLKMFKEPVKITVREYYYHKEHKPNWHLVESFDYGDYDNHVTAILHDIKISAQTMYNTENRDVYYAYLDCYYISINNAENVGYLNASYNTFVGCQGTGKDMNTIKDYLDAEITVNGIFVEDRYIKEGDVYEIVREQSEEDTAEE